MMKSGRNPRFKAMFRALPPDIKRLARENYQLWKANPRYPSLHFKRLKPTHLGVWSIRIGEHYRALGRVREDWIIWFWIGSHADYDSITKHLETSIKKKR